MVAKLSSELDRRAKPIMMEALGEHLDPNVFDKWHSSLLQGKYDEEEKAQSRLVSLELLGELQGFANLFRAAPWRIGRVLGSQGLFTCDNPVTRHFPSYRRSYGPKVFFEYDYYLALSPDVLLQVYPKPLSDGQEEKQLKWGGRQRKDFSEWKVSTACRLIAANAGRFIYMKDATPD